MLLVAKTNKLVDCWKHAVKAVSFFLMSVARLAQDRQELALKGLQFCRWLF